VSVALTARRRIPATTSIFAIRQDGPFWYSLRGGSLNLETNHRVERWSSHLMLGGTVSRVRSPGDDTPPGSKRWLAFSEIGLSGSRFTQGRRTTGSLSLQLAAGERDVADIRRFIATGTITSTQIPFALTAQFGTSASDAITEQFTLGGTPPTMLPSGVLSQFIPQPALSPFFVGKHLETYKLSVPFGGARLYGWAGRVYPDRAAPRFERVVGAEWSASFVTVPVLGTPAARLTVGAGRWMNRRDVLRQVPFDPAIYVSPSGQVQFYITTQFGDWAR
jgi:hypothetical protein